LKLAKNDLFNIHKMGWISLLPNPSHLGCRSFERWPPHMKRHVGAVLVALTTLLVIDSHLDWVQKDGQGLLVVSGMHFDVRGWVADQLLQLSRDCTTVQALPPDNPTSHEVLTVIRQHSLPDSQSARILQLLQRGQWSVAEVAFDTLNPSLVVLRMQDGRWQVQDQAVWSGSTTPWHSGDWVRRYLQQKAPDLPPSLLSCVTVEPARYGSGPVKWVPVSTNTTPQP
jgi:hypothetical protein